MGFGKFILFALMALYLVERSNCLRCKEHVCYSVNCIQEMTDNPVCIVETLYGCFHKTTYTTEGVTVTAGCARADNQCETSLEATNDLLSEKTCCTSKKCNDGNRIEIFPGSNQCYEFTCTVDKNNQMNIPENCIGEGIDRRIITSCPMDAQYGCFVRKSMSDTSVSITAGCASAKDMCTAASGESCCTMDLCNDGQMPETTTSSPTEGTTHFETTTSGPTEGTTHTETTTSSQTESTTHPETTTSSPTEGTTHTETTTSSPTEGTTHTETTTSSPTEGTTHTETTTSSPTEGTTHTETTTSSPTEKTTRTEYSTSSPTEGTTHTETTTSIPTEGTTHNKTSSSSPTEGTTATESSTNSPTEGTTHNESSTSSPNEGTTHTETTTSSTTKGTTHTVITTSSPTEFTTHTETTYATESASSPNGSSSLYFRTCLCVHVLYWMRIVIA